MCNYQFWVELSVAISTFLAVLVALFGDSIKAKFFAPKFEVSVYNPKGELNKNTNGIAIRYYHLLIKNKRQSIANNCAVYLKAVESDINVGTPFNWNGEVQLTWMYPNRDPSWYRNVGPDIRCDLLSINENCEVFLPLYYYPCNLSYKLTERFKLVFHIQVVSDQSTSMMYKFILEWDGQWESGESEMAKHLMITQQN